MGKVKSRPDSKVELYNRGEYCEDVVRGKTCLDRASNTQCNPCMRRIENINRR